MQHLNLGLIGAVHRRGRYLSSGYGYRSDTVRDGHGPWPFFGGGLRGGGGITVGAEAEEERHEAEMRVSWR